MRLQGSADKRFTGIRLPNPLKDQKLKKTIYSEISADNKTESTRATECKLNKYCGGCDFTGITYKEQLDIKEKFVKKLLKSFGEIDPIIGMNNPYHYRNKVSAAFGFERGRVISGIYAKNSHRIIHVKSCYIEDKKASEILATIRNLCRSFRIKTYDEDSDYGFLRHVLIRTGKRSGQIMVVLVTVSPVFPAGKKFTAELLKAHPEITTVIMNLNNRSTSMVLGDREKVLYGNGSITDTLCGLTFRISSKSFYQVNPVQTEKLYNRALEYAGLSGSETVLDAYCGVGTIGLIAGQKAKEVLGVELNKDAVRDAIANAKLNNIKNVRFYENDAGVFISGLVREKKKTDVVILDPPRSGSTAEFIDSVAELAPKKVVYISCNPETLARDIELFEKRGFLLKKAQPFDCFPMTEHIECVCLLTRQ